jgi:hypothetical protein
MAYYKHWCLLAFYSAVISTKPIFLVELGLRFAKNLASDIRDSGDLAKIRTHPGVHLGDACGDSPIPFYSSFVLHHICAFLALIVTMLSVWISFGHLEYRISSNHPLWFACRTVIWEIEVMPLGFRHGNNGTGGELVANIASVLGYSDWLNTHWDLDGLLMERFVDWWSQVVYQIGYWYLHRPSRLSILLSSWRSRL